MCNNPLNSRALNWRSPANIAGTITLDGQFRPVSNFFLDNPGTVALVFSNLLPGALYRFGVNATATTAQLNLPVNAYFAGGAAINLTFTGNQWYLFDFVLHNGTVIVTPAGGGTISGSFAQLNADNQFLEVALYGFKSRVRDEGGANYNFVNADTGQVIRFTNAGGCAALLHKAAPVGWMITGYQGGSNQVVFTVESGATIQNRQSHTKTAGQFAMVSIVCVQNTGGSAAVFALSGDTAL
jgi:hypothetical protein